MPGRVDEVQSLSSCARRARLYGHIAACLGFVTFAVGVAVLWLSDGSAAVPAVSAMILAATMLGVACCYLEDAARL